MTQFLLKAAQHKIHYDRMKDLGAFEKSSFVAIVTILFAIKLRDLSSHLLTTIESISPNTIVSLSLPICAIRFTCLW